MVDLEVVRVLREGFDEMLVAMPYEIGVLPGHSEELTDCRR